MPEVRVRVRRAYEESEPGDGARVLVDRIWPRGLTKAKAALELLGVIDNRNVRGPLVPLDEAEVAALRVGLAAAGVL